MRLTVLSKIGLIVLFGAVTSVEGLESTHRYHPSNYQVPRPENATLHEKVVFLPPERDWERMDIYIPKGASEARLPCVILFYGGGWGGKVGVGIKPALLALLAEGYVVAVPDYVLGAKHPVPLAIWDGAAAIRFLRAHAAQYRIDSERMGCWGFSAGGWMAQHLCPSDSGSVHRLRLDGKEYGYFPVLEPRPARAEQPIRLQGFATDWGAGKIDKGVPEDLDELLAAGRKRKQPAEHLLRPWITADDPPLFTCHNAGPGIPPRSVKLFREAGSVAEFVYLAVKGTHVPNGQTPTTWHDGTPTTWNQSNVLFLNKYVKNPTTCTSPEFYPHGVPIAGPTPVTVRCVHGAATVRYSVDGSTPTAASSPYNGPIVVKPGQTLKAIAVKRGLKPSRVTAATFPRTAIPAPRIAISQRIFKATVGQPLETTFTAEAAGMVRWYVAGRIVGKVPEAYNPNVNASKRKRMPLWLTMDAETGRLHGTPAEPGSNLILVAANVQAGDRVLVDAVSVTIQVSE